MKQRGIGTRAMALLLTLAMCLSLLPAAALAEGYDGTFEAYVFDNNAGGNNELAASLTLDSGTARFGISFDLPIYGVAFPDDIISIRMFDSEADRTYVLYENGAPKYGASMDELEGGFLSVNTVPNMAEGTYLIDIGVKNPNGGGDLWYVSSDEIIVGGTLTRPVITTSGLESGRVGQEYAQQLEGTPGDGSASLTWSVTGGSLPAGLSLNAATGKITGTPTAQGTFSFTVTAEQGNGETASRQLSITVSAALKYIVKFNLNGGTAAAGEDYSTRSVTAGTAITLPAAPTLTGYDFSGWKYGDTVCQAGASYTVTGRVSFTAQWKEKDPVTVTVPDLGELVGSVWLKAYYGPEANNWSRLFSTYFSEPAGSTGKLKTIPLSIWCFTGSHTSYSRLELCAYVDGAETVIAKYTGTVKEGSTGIALTKTDTNYAVLKSVAAAGMKAPDDYSRSLIQRNDKTLYPPCLVSTDDNAGYSTSIYGMWSSDKYAVYDWNARTGYSYSFNAASGALTVTVPTIGEPTVTLSGKATFSDGTTPVAGVTVQAKQYYKSCWRTATATTGADGSYSLKLYPNAEGYLSLYSGSEQIFFHEGSYIDNPADSVTKNLTIGYSTLRTSVQVQAAAGQETLVDRYLRGQLSTPVASVTITNAADSSKIDKKYYYVYNRVDSRDYTLCNTAAANSVTAELTGDIFAAGQTQTVPITSAIGSVTFTPVLKPGVVVNLKSATTFSACLAWYNSAGVLVNRSGSFSIGNPGRDFAFVCPGEPGGYTLVLVPNAYSGCLRPGSDFSELLDGAKTAVWNAVMENGKITELSARSFDRVDGLSATYITKPGSALYASAEGFSNTGEVVAFFGEIGLDPGLRNGRLRTLKIRTGVNSSLGTVTNSAPIQSLVINGKEYLGRLTYHYHTAYYEIYLDSENISLPCQYTIYCNPGMMDHDMDLTVTANVTADGIHGNDQLVGSAVVVRPGAYLDTLSTYVNRETVQITGRARPNEDVSIFDNDAAVGGAKADKWGEWSADIKLDGVQETGATTHIITARTASEEESGELWIIHDKNGPQLTSYTMTWTEWETRTINVGDPYTFYGHQMKDVTFTAVIDKPDKLEVMSEWGDGVKAVTKVYTTDGEIRFVPMTQNGDTFTGKVNTTLRDSICYAELMYLPMLPEETITGETVETIPNVSVSEVTAELPTSGSVDTLTSDDNWNVTFTGNDIVLSGNTDGLSKAEFQQAADEMQQKNLKLRSISMRHDVSGQEESTLAWLNSIYDQRKADTSEHDTVYTFSGVLTDETAFDNARANIEKISVDTHGKGEDVLPSMIQDSAGHTIYRYILTDAWTYEGVTTYTYFVYATFVKSTVAGETPYTVLITAELATDFNGYFRYTADAPKPDPAAASGGGQVTGLASDAGSGTRLVKLLGHLTTSTSSGFSNNNGPMYGYPSERQETATGSNYGPPPKPSEKYYGKFDLDKAESYQQKQENALEDALGNGSAAFGLVGDGAGWVGTVLGLTSYQKAIVRRNRYSGYTSDMRDEIWNMEMSPCYKNLNPTQKEIVQKLIRNIDREWAGYQLSNIGANLTDLGINLASVGGGLAGLTWKKGAALTVGGYAAGKANGGANDKAFNRFVQKYESSYKTIDSMMRNAAVASGSSDCKKDQKAKNTNKLRSSEGGSFPNNNDPSGIVYEAVIQNPVEGAQVTLYYAANAGGSIVREGTAVDAETGKKIGTGSVEPGNAVSNLKIAEDVRYLLPQEAVQVTGENGKFSWGVPEGLWFVTARYAGLEGSSNADKAATVSVSGLTLDGEAVTNLLPVLPVQLDVNIPLVDETAPVVEEVRFTDEGIFVTFSKYMEDMARDNTSVLTDGNYVLTDAEESAVALTVTPEVQGNTPDNLRDAAVKTFTKTVRLTPAVGSFPAGDLTLTVAGTVTSYAGTAMGMDYNETAKVSEMAQLGAPAFGLASGTEVQRGDAVEISLPADAPEGARICYTTDGSDPAADSRVYDGPVAVTDDMTIRAVAVCAGWQTSDAASASFTIAKAKTAEEVQGSISVTQTDSGLSVRVVPPLGESFAMGFCAAYDKDGKMLAVQPLSAGGGEQTLTLVCDADKACTVKAFLLNSNYGPVVSALTWTNSQ